MKLAVVLFAFLSCAVLASCETESCNDTASCEAKSASEAGASAADDGESDAGYLEQDGSVDTRDDPTEGHDDTVPSTGTAPSTTGTLAPKHEDAGTSDLADSGPPTATEQDAATNSSSVTQSESEAGAISAPSETDSGSASDPSQSVVVCLTSNDCAGVTPNCVGGQCRECVVGNQNSCNAGEHCVETTRGPRCTACSPEGDLGCAGGMPECVLETASARCAPCDPSDHEGCSILMPFCTAEYSCVECLDDEGCDEAASCVEGECVDVMVDRCVEEEAPDLVVPPNLPPNAEGIMCVPNASGVPGMLGAPQWWADAPQTYTKLDDPRWVGATSVVYPDLGQFTQAVLRVVVDSGRLHFSFHALEDPSGVSMEDWAYVALSQDETSPAKIVGIRINTNTISEDVQHLGAGNYSIHYFDTTNPTATWGAPESTSWANNIGVWNLSPDEWAINFTVDLADVGISGSTFRMWTGLVMLATNFPDTFVTYAWPMGTSGAVSAYNYVPPPGLAGTPDPIIDIDEWGAVVLGTSAPCLDGVSLNSSQVGIETESCLVHEVNLATNNTFSVQPRYAGIASGGENKLAARWRMMDCDGPPSGNWVDVPGFQDVQSDTSGQLTKTCSASSTEGFDTCPGVGEPPSRKCALVNLLPGTNPGPQPLTFLQDSAYVELEFIESQ